MIEEDEANMAKRLIVVENFCYSCPFCVPVSPERKANSGNPVTECKHPVFVHVEGLTRPVLNEDHAFIPVGCPLRKGTWTVELHPKERSPEG